MSLNKIRGSVLVTRWGGHCFLNRIRTVELDFPEDAVDSDVIVKCKCRADIETKAYFSDEVIYFKVLKATLTHFNEKWY